MARNILLTNLHSDCNAGDYALRQVACEQLQANFTGCKLALSLNDPTHYQGDLPALASFSSWVKEGRRYHMGRLLSLLPTTVIPTLTARLFGRPWYGLTPMPLRIWMHTLLEADFVVSAAGGFLYHSGKGVTLLLSLFPLALAALAGKPFYLLPQSYGPLRGGWQAWLLRSVLRRARLIMAREPLSMEILRAWGVAQNTCLLVPDLAFGFEGLPPEAGRAWLKAQGITAGRPLLAVTALDWEALNPAFRDQEAYEEALVKVMRHFAEVQNGQVLLLPQCWGPSWVEDDRRVAHRLAERLSQVRPAPLAVDQPLAPELLQAVLGEADFVLGTRLHSLIFALARSVPGLFLEYLPKTAGLARLVGLEEWVVPLPGITPQALLEKFQRAWEMRRETRRHLRRLMPTLIAQSRQAGALIAADYAALCQERSRP